MENTNKNRAILFIDGNNFYYRQKTLLSGKKEIFILLDFNFVNFSKNLIKSDELVDIRYYIGAVQRQWGTNKEKSERMYADQQKLIAKLQQQKIPVILGNLIQHSDKSFHEKGVDVRLAVEMIRLAREDKYDTAYLLSSDTDLVPAVEEVQLLGKRVVYVGISEKQSFGLTKTSDHTILLREEDIIPFTPVLHHMKLGPSPFEKIKTGKKIIEVRLFDEKRKELKVCDEIEFSLVGNTNDKIRVKIKNLVQHKTFSSLYETFSPELFGTENKENFIKSMYNIYTKEHENKYGVLGICLEYIK